MNAKIKKMWVKALRSGKYKQNHGALKTDNKFCCLGVLCSIYGKIKNVKWKVDKDGHETFLDEFGTLPSPVYKWAGLPHPNPSVTINKKENIMENLADLNDGNTHTKNRKSLSFKQIANLIEKHL